MSENCQCIGTDCLAELHREVVCGRTGKRRIISTGMREEVRIVCYACAIASLDSGEWELYPVKEREL